MFPISQSLPRDPICDPAERVENDIELLLATVFTKESLVVPLIK